MMNKESLLKGCLLGILGFAAQWVTAQTFDNETGNGHLGNVRRCQ